MVIPRTERYRFGMSGSVPLLVYDGDCSFCAASADWVAGRWRGRARAVAWQTLAPDELAAHALTLDDVRSAAWWVDQTGHRSRGHLAIAYALRAGSGWSATVGGVLLVPPFRWIAAAAYPLVARWRYRLPGGSAACRTEPKREASRSDPDSAASSRHIHAKRSLWPLTLRAKQ